MSIVSAVASVVQRTDSWVNALTGLGTLRDKLTHAQVVQGTKLSDGVLEALFNDDDLAKRIVNKIPRDATRRGFRLKLEGADDDESVEVNRELMAQLHELSAMPKLREAWIWGRLYGGGALYLGADDGQAPDQPLNEEAIRTLTFLNVLKRPQLRIRKRYDDVTVEYYGEPELFEVVRSTSEFGASNSATGTLIHASRLIIFDGALTATAVNQRPEGWWTDSVLQCVHDALRQTATSWQSAAHLISDASQGVLKIANLVDLIATNGQEELRTRIQMMDLARSVCRALLIDADRESFERVATSFAGLPEMMDRLMMRVASAAEMPVTLLFGRSPAGLNATGESDIRGWYDTVADAQTDVLKPRLERLLRVVMSAGGSATGGSVPDSWTIEFNPLWQPNELELATILKMKADTHVALVGAQIEMEAEAGIALSEDIPTIDAEHRRTLLATDIAEGLRPGEATSGTEPDDDDDDEVEDDEPRGDAADQPRVPAGSPHGGQFAGKAGGWVKSAGAGFEVDEYMHPSGARLVKHKTKTGRTKDWELVFPDGTKRSLGKRANLGDQDAALEEWSRKAQPAKIQTPPGGSSKSAAELTAGKKLLGEGASRKVYDDGDTVIKVAKDRSARADNKAEMQLSGRNELLAPIVEGAPDGSWVRQEKLLPTTTSELAGSFGVSRADQSRLHSVVIKDPWGFDQEVHGKDWLFAATHAAMGGAVKGLGSSTRNYVGALSKLKADVPEIDLTDLAFAHQWGKTQSGQAKIADYSWTTKTARGRKKKRGDSGDELNDPEGGGGNATADPEAPPSARQE